jgi:serine protease Do
MSLQFWIRALVVVSSLVAGGAHAQAPAKPSTDLTQGEIAQAVERINAAVIGIEVKATEGARSARTLGAAREGTAVVIGEDGLALTIGYLVLEADEITLTTPEGKRFPGRVVAYDLASGFGLVAPVIPLDWPRVRLGDSGALKADESLIVSTGGEDGVYGLTQLVAQRKFSGYWEYHIDQALFTSPPVENHSGAGIFNLRGELVGIGSLFVGDTLENASARRPGNMAVPVDLLKPILSELREKGFSQASRRPWIGLNAVAANGEVRVARVNPASPASAAGLNAGDVIVAVDGDAVKELEQLYKSIWKRASPESEIEFTVRQQGTERKLKLRSVDRMQTLVKPQGI